MSNDTTVPLSSADLDIHTLLGLSDVEPDDELWVPASMIRGNKFRAVKVQVLDRVSVNNFEELNAMDKWPTSDRYPTNHEIAEGIGSPDF